MPLRQMRVTEKMAKLTDRQRKKIIAERALGASVRALAAKYKVSPTTIRNTLKNDPETVQKCARKKEENARSVLAFMESRKNAVCDILDKILTAMGDEGKIAATSLSQLATAMGIVIDKYTAGEAPKLSDMSANNLFEAIKAVGEEDLNGIPEVQLPAENGADVVEN